MALQPTRRQKRPIVLSSDSEDDLTTATQCLSETVSCSNNQLKSKRINGDIFSSQPLPKRSRPRTRSSTLKFHPSDFAQSIPSRSIENLSRGRSKAYKNEKVESLRPSSSAAGIKRRQVVAPNTSINEAEINPTDEDKDKEEEEEEDVIEDDISDLGFPKRTSLRSTTKFVLDRRKQHLASAPRVPDPKNSEKHRSLSQVFAVSEKHLSNESSLKTANGLNHEHLKPWAENYGPTSLDELTVHKKKVADVRNWIERFWQDGNKKILVLRGPAGAGKTATVMALAKSMDIDIVEWKNPNDTHFSSGEHLSMSAQFEDFLQRSGKFGSLDFSDRVPDRKLASASEKSMSELNRKKIILVEEFPHTFTGTSSAAMSFRTSLLHYLTINPPSLSLSRDLRLYGNRTPVIMIITESQLNPGGSTEGVFSAHRLLGPDLLGHPNVSVIEFNTMAPTYVVKALELVVKKEARQSGRRRIPGLSLLQKLGESGDVRSAISALEFLCLRNSNEGDWSGTVARKSKSMNNTSALTKVEIDSLEKITRREASLGIFHAVGKVVYNKREETSNTNPLSPQPPEHMSQHARPRISSVSPDELIDSTGTDRQTFIAALHENYVSSCEGVSFMDSLNGCLDALSDTDVLSSERSGRGSYGGLSGYGRGTSESLRQDEIGFHLAVRGILFALPCPVKRCTLPTRNGSKGDAFKMFYPTSLRLWKQIEEVESFVDQWAERYTADLNTKRLPDASRFGATAAQHSETFSEASNVDGCKFMSSDAELLCQYKNASRLELILETLPHLAIIERAKGSSVNLRNLQKITEFHGLDKLSNEFLENEVWPGLDRDVDFSAGSVSSQKPRSDRQPEPVVPTLNEEIEVEIKTGKLWLSDDDIEDD